MESTNDPAAAAAALRASERARAALAESLVVPRGHDAVIGVAVAVQILTMAIGLFVEQAWARALLGAGLVVFGIAAVVEVRRFRQLNGVRLDGFVSRVVLGGDAWASSSYAVSAVLAYVAAASERWWLVAVFAVVGGSFYALSGRRWMNRYRASPEGRAGTESALLLGVAIAVAVVGVVALAVGS
jgi:hypothetical protein